MKVFRCPTCIALLPDPDARRCPTCGQNLRRRRPGVLGRGGRAAPPATVDLPAEERREREERRPEPAPPGEAGRGAPAGEAEAPVVDVAAEEAAETAGAGTAETAGTGEVVDVAAEEAADAAGAAEPAGAHEPPRASAAAPAGGAWLGIPRAFDPPAPSPVRPDRRPRWRRA